MGCRVAETEKKKLFLNYDGPVALYQRDDLQKVFEDMRSEMSGQVQAQHFHAAARNIGTHLPKLINPRATSNAITFEAPHGRNSIRQYHASGNAGHGKYANVILRPIAIEHGGEARSFVARLESPDALTEPLKQAFASVFGSEALKLVMNGLRERGASLRKVSIHYSDYPVFFIPGLERRDLQASPIASAETFHNMRALRGRLFHERNNMRFEDGSPQRSIGDWIGIIVSAKLQNAVLSTKGKRWRFHAKLPGVGSSYTRALWHYVKGGPFPIWRDAKIARAVEAYCKAVGPDIYLNHDIRRGLDQRADAIIDAALLFIDQTLLKAADLDPDFDDRANRPQVWAVVASLPFAKSTYRSVIANAVQRGHFQERVKDAERRQ